MILDDLIVAEDKRVDCAPGAERKNIVFEYVARSRDRDRHRNRNHRPILPAPSTPPSTHGWWMQYDAHPLALPYTPMPARPPFGMDDIYIYIYIYIYMRLTLPGVQVQRAD